MHTSLRHRPARFAGAVLLLLVLVLGPFSSQVSSAIQPGPSPAVFAADLVSNGQFVLGPAARKFDLSGYLRDSGSPLLASAGLIEARCAYASINPQVVLVLLEMDGQQVTQGWRIPLNEDARSEAVEDLVIGLAERFYDHLYTCGERAPAGAGTRSAPSLTLADGTIAGISPATSSATFAIASTLAATLASAQFAVAVDPAGPGGFTATWVRLFPDSEPLDASVSITPQGLPPSGLLQFPFPAGQKWWFNGAHNWNGNGATYGKPYSSMDFFTSADSCSAPPAGDWAVGAAGGNGYHPSGYPCWYRIDHGGGWSTSYYHLRGVAANGPMVANGKIGTIGCETCAGGFATGPHVHFSLLYNGAYVDLEGVQLSGWTVHTGNGDYQTGLLERNGVQLKPYSSVLNEPVAGATATPTITPTVTPISTATLTPGMTATPTATLTPSATSTPPSSPVARFIYPQAQGLVRTCPVALFADVAVPGGAASTTFWASYGGTIHEIGADHDGSDGWQVDWDCEDVPDGPATLSLSVTGAAGREVVSEGGATPVRLSKACTEGTYRTAFFANTGLAGAPASSWCKASGVSYDWGSGSPGAGIPGADSFSARFRGDFRIESGIYRFTAQSDDGVRVWVDRVLRVDDWRDHATGIDRHEFTVALTAGLHEIWLDYYEQSGPAAVALIWQRSSTATPRLYLPAIVAMQ